MVLKEIQLWMNKDEEFFERWMNDESKISNLINDYGSFSHTKQPKLSSISVPSHHFNREYNEFKWKYLRPPAISCAAAYTFVTAY